MQPDKIHNKSCVILLHFANFTDSYSLLIAFLIVLLYTSMKREGVLCLDAKTISKEKKASDWRKRWENTVILMIRSGNM